MEDANRSNLASEGWHTMTPRIVADDASQLVEFLRQVFGATGEYRQARQSEIRIDDSLVMISDAGIRNAIPTPGLISISMSTVGRKLA